MLRRGSQVAEFSESDLAKLVLMFSKTQRVNISVGWSEFKPSNSRDREFFSEPQPRVDDSQEEISFEKKNVGRLDVTGFDSLERKRTLSENNTSTMRTQQMINNEIS